jgi:PIN domain nuclease of toxin-antitoxin system
MNEGVSQGSLDCALDASAVLALVHHEPGAEIVQRHMAAAGISAVSWAEVAQKATTRGVDVVQVRRYIEALGVGIVPLDATAAEAAAALWSATRQAGLSLGYRCCLALAQQLGVPALTADRSWAELNIGVEVRVIR